MKVFPQAKPMYVASADGKIEQHGEIGGLDLRDYFAVCVAQGLVARGSHLCSNIPEVAYKMADAMIKEREKPHE